MNIGTRIPLILVAYVFLGSSAIAVESKDCERAGLKGELYGKFEAHEKKKARKWVPLGLKLCRNSGGVYAILSFEAQGEEIIAGPPLRTPDYRDVAEGDPLIVLQVSGKEDDLAALKAFEEEGVKAVLVGGSSATQATIFRKQFDRVYSNTLFGGQVEGEKK